MASDQRVCLSGRGDLNSRPPAPKARWAQFAEQVFQLFGLVRGGAGLAGGCGGCPVLAVATRAWRARWAIGAGWCQCSRRWISSAGRATMSFGLPDARLDATTSDSAATGRSRELRVMVVAPGVRLACHRGIRQV